MKTRLSRGQNLVLFALTLMLLTLMVLMTLSFGAKVKSRMELQTLADTAAYSNAVATSRTLNSIAVMNRVTIAHTVSTIGTISLISWCTQYWKHAKNASELWFRETIIFALGLIWCICPGPTCRPPACRSCIRGIIQTGIAGLLMMFEANRAERKLENDTRLFRDETNPRYRASWAMYDDMNTMRGNLVSRLTAATGAFAGDYATKGNLRGVTEKDTPGTLNTSDLDNAIKQVDVNDRNATYPAASIVNASRGHPFITNRNSGRFGGIFGPWAIKLSFPWTLIAAGWVFTTGSSDDGLGYVHETWTTNLTGLPSQGKHFGSYANDDGATTRVLLIKPYGPMCTIFGPLALIAGLLGKDTGMIRVGPFTHTGIHSTQHSFYTFPPFYDYNPLGLASQDDLYAVPKNMSLVAADPLARNDAWDRRGNDRGTTGGFNFKFTSGGAKMDMVNNTAEAATGGTQNAIGAGVSYYSRPGFLTYEEPPNLFAPYWRSTLTRMTVDRPAAGVRAGYDSALETMFGSSGQPEAGVTFRELVNAGYKGFE
jgi:hypothetical protein